MMGDDTRTARPRCVLKPMNLHNQEEFDELVKQRVMCGWNFDTKSIEEWRQAIDDNLKAMFWIFAAPTSAKGSVTEEGADPEPAKSTPEDPQLDSQLVRVGHISLLKHLDPPEPDLVAPDKSSIMLSTFFILPQHRRGGVGRAAVQAVEAMARVPPHGWPGCRAMTLTTLSRRYAEDDGEEWRGSYARWGREPPERGQSVEDWYRRMGYVPFKEEGRYKSKLPDGTTFLSMATFLRKALV